MAVTLHGLLLLQCGMMQSKSIANLNCQCFDRSWFQYCRSADSSLNEQEKASVELVFVGAKGSAELEQESVRCAYL